MRLVVQGGYDPRYGGIRPSHGGSPDQMNRRYVAPLLIAAVALIAGGCQAVSLQEPVTEQALLVKDLYNLVFIIAAIVFFLVEGLIVWSVIRYRRKPTDTNLPVQTHGNLILEIIWTAIPMVTVFLLFIASWNVLNVVDARDASKAEVKVEVVGYQWQWKFAYPDDGIEVFGTPDQNPELVVPLGKVVQVTLVGQDVNHGFYIPQFLFQRDLVPGHVNVFQFTPNKLGTFTGQCSAFCGLLHHAMRFTVRVVTPEEYTAWLADSKPKPTPPASGAIDGTEKEWEIKISAAKHVPGSITFNLTNNGTIPHEFLVVRTDKTAAELLSDVDPGTDRIDEALLDVIDEQPEYEAGTPGTVTVNLPVGHYVVMCNIQGHYKNGMYADLDIVNGPAAMRLTSRMAF